ncbi:hypothetical protein BCR33DRAFT_714205 [Rhizoclosmatium globosum]|uniref:Uncharacterized protein n=1 Tax=Rhizoclosmatium globosum TaxID=329046 RepID=A0A1Y2CQ59_9FUNG|nr:hypothetical protein BCR33DRAFT_714205 [Rhizoclosmatium globosum]|eukprot:ORY49169.1 hypothetical protein BCR33DRAFT_714205 [Rhizoclosmatium globosum]
MYTNAFNEIEFQDLWITVSVSILILIILFRLILKQSTIAKGQSPIFTSISILLFAILTFNLVAMVFSLTLENETAPTPAVVGNTVIAACYILVDVSLVMYAWKRVLPVSQVIFPASLPLLSGFVILFAVAELIRLICSTLRFLAVFHGILISYESVFTIARDALVITLNICMITFEMCVTGIYIHYLRIMNNSGLEVQKLRILSRFGIASSVVVLVWLTSIDLFYSWSVATSPPVRVGELGIDIVLRIYDLGPLVYLLIQLAMKYWLLREEENNDNERRERIATAKITTGFNQGSKNDIQDSIRDGSLIPSHESKQTDQ